MTIFLNIGIFLFKKMTDSRKITEKEMLEQLRRGQISLPPLSLRFLEQEPRIGATRLDAMLEAKWQGNKMRFAVECKALSTPKTFQNAINLLKSLNFPKTIRPMLLMPFLSEQQLLDLESRGISGIDLCGNGVVIAPELMAIFRSGAKNRFSSSAPIKNIYRKNSSMVARVFLSRAAYGSVQEILAEINRRNPLLKQWDKKPMNLSTVSKSLKALEDDLIVGRGEDIRLLQPDKLLEKLSANFVPLKIRERIFFKMPEKTGTIREWLAVQSRKSGLPFAATGMSSVGQFAVMQAGDVLSVYCPRIEPFMEGLSGSESDRFPNLELIETDDETVYFDAKEENGFWWASPVQVYLELMAGDKRDRVTAEQVKAYLLKNFQQSQS